MRPAGQRDKLVTVQRATFATDENNEDVPTWAPIGQEWARIIWGLGAERREAAQTQARQAATFQVLDNSLTRSLTASDRIMWNGMAWDIAAPGVPIARGELEISASAAVS